MAKRTRRSPPSKSPRSKTGAQREVLPSVGTGASLPRPRTQTWLSDSQRRLVTELNSQLLQGMLRYADTAKATGLTHPRVRILEQLSELDVTARVRLTKVPFVLLDAAFTNGGMWASERLGRSFTTMEDSVWIDGYDLHVLARSLFTFAWHFTRTHTHAARIVFGMAEQTSGIFAALSLRELERLILQRGHWVRPRWEDKPERWERLFERAVHGDAAILDQRALQLLYGDLFEDLS